MAAEPDDIDALFGLEPSEFVAARDELAKRLRKQGDRDAAAEVKSLRRPTAAAWALNQVSRRSPDDIDELLRAGEAVRAAQADVVESGGAGTLRETAERRRSLIAEVARAASTLVGGAHHDEITATLQTASIEPNAGSSLRQGRLTKELPAPSGFGLAGMPEPAERPPTPARRPVDRDRREREVEREQLQRHLERAGKAVEAAEDQLRQAEERRAAATVAVERAEAALADARRTYDDARTARDTAEGDHP